jgi:predicted GIY-YIG superfamily endonuclease
MVYQRDPALDAEHFVYVIGIDNGPHKIGIAKDVENRLGQLQNGNPFRLHIRFKLTTTFGAACQVEQMAHWLIRNRRMMGEWFSVDAASCERVVVRAAQLVEQGHSALWFRVEEQDRAAKEALQQPRAPKRKSKREPYDPLAAHRYKRA